MKRVLLLLLLLLPTVLVLPGCVVVVGADADDGVHWGSRDYRENGVQHDGERLSRDVARVLGANAELIAEDIRVSSDDGEVVLRGRVGDVALVEKAIATTRSVDGVERVVSRLVVDAG